MANDFQADVLDHLGYVLGGSASTGSISGQAVTRFWSGHMNGDDGTGIQAPTYDPVFQGVYSIAPGAVTATPVGILIPRTFTALLRMQGPEENTDLVDFLLLLSNADNVAQMPNATAYRDLVPAQLRAHMTLKDATGTPTPNILQAFVTDGKFGRIAWADATYYGWSFTIQVRRLPIETYIS